MIKIKPQSFMELNEESNIPPKSQTLFLKNIVSQDILNAEETNSKMPGFLAWNNLQKI